MAEQSIVGTADAVHSVAAPWAHGSLAISRRGEAVDLPGIAGRKTYLMVSVKNRDFSRRLLRGFCELAAAHGCDAEVILVDEPYFEAVRAAETDPVTRDAELAKLTRVTAERRRLIERVLAADAPAMPLRTFFEVHDEVPPEWVAEVREAFEFHPRFRAAVLERTREVLPPGAHDDRLAHRAEFLVSEIPFLCHLYYNHAGPAVVDCYPGECPQLFWDIDLGRYADALPRITRMVRRSEPLIYVDMQLAST